MATSEQTIGRRHAIGVGIEAVPGTPVDPQTYLGYLEGNIQPRTTVVENESAMGVVDAVNDSEVVAKYAEGPLRMKVTDEGIGFLLTGFFGAPSTGTAVGGIYPHTFVMDQSSVPKTLTVSQYTPLVTKRHPYGVIDSLEITNEAGGWVEVAAAIKARVGDTATLTPALAEVTEFTSKHVTVKLAADTASLSAATALKASRVRLNLERPSEAFNPLGTDDEPEFDRGSFRATGELVIRYTDTQYEDDFLANTAKAMSVTIANGNKSLAFTMGKVRTRELERSGDLDAIVTQTLSFVAEWSATDSRSIQALLNNARATYEAA